MIDIFQRLRWFALAALLVGQPLLLAAQETRTEHEGAQALGLSLRKLGVAKRVLMIGAHPDDESTQILSTLALGQGAEVGYLSLTRGEGGQNGIGAELGEGLGLLRSGELLSARRLDGARQFFTRAYDYGFSKSAEEAFRHWPQDSLLADVVGVIRVFRPDVVISVFNGTPADGHGQHQAAGIVARLAFDAAGDPARFPEQLRGGVRPFSPQKLYQGVWSREGGTATELATGAFDPLLGRSYFQVAMASRSRHRSQDMGRPLTPGPQSSRLRLAQSRGTASSAAEGVSLFAGLDTTLSALAARTAAGQASAPRVELLLRRYEVSVTALRERFNPLQQAALVRALAEATAALDSAARQLGAAGAEGELATRIVAEQAKARTSLALAAGLVFDAVASAERVVPGQTFELVLRLWNGGAQSVRVAALAPRLPEGWTVEAVEPLPETLAAGALLSRQFRVTVPAGAPTTEPYFLRSARAGDLYVWPAGASPFGAPFQPAEIGGAARLVVGTTTLGLESPAQARVLDKMFGELERPVWVVPAVTLDVRPGVAIMPMGAAPGATAPLALQVHLATEAPSGVSGNVSLDLPPGWRSEPAAIPVALMTAGQRETLKFQVLPTASAAASSVEIRARFRSESGELFERGYSAVDYPHIEPYPLYRDAVARVELFPVRVAPGLRVGYVMGAGDDGPDALAQLGVQVELLDDAALSLADLGRYSAIVTGIRAYEVRPALIANNTRLLDYVRGGGTLIAQYNKYEYTVPGIAPYPLKMARPHGRVTDENAAVRLLAPQSRALSWPNVIGPADFEGWVQERGLYFISEWDSRYTPLLEMSDPGEAPERGALLVTPYGKGTYVYTGLALFRQLPAGVPGAYRLLANLVSLGAPAR